MSKTFGMPGPSGSLGVCALCGKTFVPEILLGKTARQFKWGGCDQELFAHESCAQKHLGGIKRELLPPESPILVAIEEWEAEHNEKVTA